MAFRTDLADGWRLRLADADDPAVPREVRDALPIPAEVPGTAHTDLLRAGLIPDPHLDRNEDELTWIGWTDWVYEREFDHTLVEGERVAVVFEGLDTVATVTLNGVTVAETENMHRRYDVALDGPLRDGRNLLSVRFTSPRAFGESERERIGDLPAQYPGPFNFMRKSACNFGWDWGPDLASAGIWRPVTLVRSRAPRIREVTPTLGVDAGLGRAAFHVALDRAADAPQRVTASVGSVSVETTIAAGATDVEVVVEVDQPLLWWPRGFGDPALYDASVVIRGDDSSEELDRWSRRVGFRTVRLDTDADEEGSRFVLVVNDQPIPVRGVNWIPDDCFFPRVTPERLRARLEQAIDADVNLIRVWGGGTYESREFYETCDETGLLVWQDFLFACAAYPEDDRLAREVEAEARDNVSRLMPHPSLVLWNGNNENIWGQLDWDWQPRIGDRAWGLGYYLDLLPRVVAEVDPSRPYWPGSPYSGSLDIHPNDEDHGTMHVWDVWNRADYPVYREHRPRFAAEFGWQAPPTWSTLVGAVHDDPIGPATPGMLAHQKAEDGAGKLARGLEPHLPEPAALEDWLLSTQLVQAWAVRTGIEHFRALRPHCSGTIMWQLNDCWPAISWAAVDGDGRKKPLWYAMRAAHRPLLVTIQPDDGIPGAVLVNDRPTAWRGDIVARRLSFDGVTLAEHTVPGEVGPVGRTSIPLPAELTTPDAPSRELLVLEADGVRACWFFVEPRDMELDDPELEVDVRRDGEEVLVAITSARLAVDLCLFPDRIAPAAEVDDALITLLPGETRHLRVRGLPTGDEHRLVSSPVLRTVNDLIIGARAVTGRP